MSFSVVPTSTIGLYEATRPANFAPQADSNQFWGPEGFNFKDLLDVVNPLQQLPVISTVYRAVTGDTISTGARLAGGALLGGPVGFASALLNVIVEGQTGEDIGSNILDSVTGDQQAGGSASSASSGFSSYSTHTEAYKRAAYLAYSNATKLS